MKKRCVPELTNALTRREAVLVLAWFPVHIILLPLAAGVLTAAGYISAGTANLAVYAVGAVYMVFAARGFLRRDFDRLCDRFLTVLTQLAVCYAVTLLCNLLFSLIISAVPVETENPNNAAVAEIASESYGPMAAAAVFLAPIVEELLFRAGLFGCIRKKNRAAAYAVSMLLFSLYHVWGYALEDAMYWIYLVQYLPVSYLLCRCYERSDTIWGSIFLHMMINGVAMRAFLLLEEMM